MKKQNIHSDIVILGAGIGGYQAFRALSKKLKRKKLNKVITIVDQNNFFTFTPLLHEVMAGGVEPSHAAIPLRELVYNTPHRFFKAKIEKIVPEEKTVITDRGAIAYDYCITALGSGVNYCDIKGAKEFSYNARTMQEAMRLREDLISRLESDEMETIITIVGGGYTGIEVASQLGYFVQHDFKQLYPKDKITVQIIEYGDRLVPGLNPRALKKLIKRLEKLKIAVKLKTAVKEVKKNKLVLADGTEIVSDFTVWCAGIGNCGNKYLPSDYCEWGRVAVNEFLQSKKSEYLYAVGDVALARNPGVPAPHPQLGETAWEQANYVVKHIISRISDGKVPDPFKFHQLGTFMPIGEKYALVIIGPVVLSGLPAWWIRRLAYVMFMPGILRKIQLVFDWTLQMFGFSYITDLEK